jgi:hypothetical protein
MAIKQATLGAGVPYTNASGHVKLALVTATQDTITPAELGGGLPELAEHEAHLMIFSASGNHYPRMSIPFADPPTEGERTFVPLDD